MITKNTNTEEACLKFVIAMAAQEAKSTYDQLMNLLFFHRLSLLTVDLPIEVHTMVLH